MQRTRAGIRVLQSCQCFLQQGGSSSSSSSSVLTPWWRSSASSSSSGWCQAGWADRLGGVRVMSSHHQIHSDTCWALHPPPPCITTAPSAWHSTWAHLARSAETAAAGAAGAVTGALLLLGGSSLLGGAAAAEPNNQQQTAREFPTVWFGFESGFESKYEVGKEMGQGSFGVVRMCRDREDHSWHAVKVLDKRKITNAEGIEDIDREVELLMQVRGHKNVINLLGAYEDERTVYLVMELCQGGDIYDKLEDCKGRLTEQDVAEIVFQMLAALAHCHLKGVVLCDVKPDNFLFTKKNKTVKGAGPLRAIDLGLSRRFVPGKALRRAAGTAYFVAPEVLRYEYGPESDLWSVGIIAYLLLSGGVPFDGDSEREILKKVVREEASFDSPQWKRVSPEAKDLVASMLTRDATMRPSAAGALSHPWFRAMHKTTDKTPLDAAVLSALHTFSNSGRMKKMAIRAMARETVSAKLEAVLQLEQQFKTIDLDCSGMISIEELRGALKHSNLKYTDVELEDLLKGIDMAGEGKINYLEFVAAAINLHQLAVQNTEQFQQLARAAFDKFDLDKSGYFTAEELKEALQTTRKCYSQGSEITDQFVKDLISQVDTDGDGKVSFEEFLALLHTTDRPESFSRYGWVKNPKAM